MKQVLIFTDLDGTLLDHDTYDFKGAKSGLDLLMRKAIPVIICSSKTRAEIELYRLRMGLSAPFVVENGGAVFIPGNVLDLSDTPFVEQGPYRVAELGIPYAHLCAIWKHVKKKEKIRMKGFSEMTIEEIATHTRLPLEEAGLAARREYSEPFVFSDTEAKFRLLAQLLGKKGLKITRGGRFYHVAGQNDKGASVEILKKIYAKTYPHTQVVTAGLGDSANDIPMLRQVDIPIVIRKKTGAWERMEGIEGVVYSDKAGPKGWAETVRALL